VYALVLLWRSPSVTGLPRRLSSKVSRAVSEAFRKPVADCVGRRVCARREPVIQLAGPTVRKIAQVGRRREPTSATARSGCNPLRQLRSRPAHHHPDGPDASSSTRAADFRRQGIPSARARSGCGLGYGRRRRGQRRRWNTSSIETGRTPWKLWFPASPTRTFWRRAPAATSPPRAGRSARRRIRSRRRRL
jgi:hypothetical protein